MENIITFTAAKINFHVDFPFSSQHPDSYRESDPLLVFMLTSSFMIFAFLGILLALMLICLHQGCDSRLISQERK